MLFEGKKLRKRMRKSTHPFLHSRYLISSIETTQGMFSKEKLNILRLRTKETKDREVEVQRRGKCLLRR